jgi:hypothetical protein
MSAAKKHSPDGDRSFTNIRQENLRGDIMKRIEARP